MLARRHHKQCRLVIPIGGERLSHLFADGVILAANSISELQEMLRDIDSTSKPVRLNMHLGKTKIMCNKYVNATNVAVHGKKIEEVDIYVYQGQEITDNNDQEVKRQIGLSWAAFRRSENILKGRKAEIRLKRKAFNECILPAMVYSSENWSRKLVT